jgi:virginiamycin B lyase
MQFGRTYNLYAAMMVAVCAVGGMAPKAALAQEALTLSKFPAGFDATPAPHSPVSIALGPDGNMWFTDADSNPEIGVVTPNGNVSYFTTGFVSGAKPGVIVAGPDGKMWFTDTGKGGLGTIATDGVVNEYIVVRGSAPVIGTSLAVGPDDNLWFTESSGTAIDKVSPSLGGSVEYTSGISPSAGIQQITKGPDGNMWFTEAGLDRIGSISPSGRVMEYGSGISPSAGLGSIVTGPDGNIWFMENSTGKIGRITPQGQITEFATGFSTKAAPFVIAAANDGNLWVGQGFGGLVGNEGFNRIARVTTSGVVTQFSGDITNLNNPGPITGINAGAGQTVWFTQEATNFINKLSVSQETSLTSAVLPGGRTVTPGTPATVYATMINSSASQLDNCGVSLPGTAPVSMTIDYQTTDASSNALTGTANVPFSLSANGGTQSLILTLNSPTQTSADNLPLNYSCNGSSAAVIGGLNTLDANFVADAAPDNIVVIASQTPGLVSMSIPGAGAFSVATANDGGSDINALTMVSVDTGLAVLPVKVSVCQTNPGTGVCLAPPEPQGFYNLPAGTEATFAVFITATGSVPFDPANNRVFIRFIDFDDFLATYVSGSASIAIQAN